MPKTRRISNLAQQTLDAARNSLSGPAIPQLDGIIESSTGDPPTVG
jgi:hypothetical protein